jgi:2-C-methyl-D-erythritol 4-phosphate cytidylyltransferase
MDKYAVIVAGGTGQRMGSDMPKQFLHLNDRPMMLYTIDAFIQAFDGIRFVVVVHPDYYAYAESILNGHLDSQSIQLIKGGETRFHSVKNGIGVVPDDSMIFIHDAVRCLISPELIRRCYSEAEKFTNAIPVVPIRDSIRKWDAETDESHVIDRTGLYAIQTPQVFLSNLIKKAFDLEYRDAFTDEATVFEANGGQVHLIEGEGRNIKVTYPQDLEYASFILKHS